jgi:2-desacetyl-2-hydroxyethyl bacteriochlorophyllide A dehydrogenase
MESVILTGEREFALQDMPAPTLAPGEALLKVELCGICGTDLHAPLLGDVFVPPVILGHEFTASVADVGDGVVDFEVGDRVVVNPIALACGECESCLSGHPNVCLTGVTAEGVGMGKDGGMAPYVSLATGHLHRLPDDLAPEVAVWVEPLAVAVRGVRRAGVGLGDRVAVVGAGPIGQLASQAARVAGATEILVVESSKYRRETAEACGADRTAAPGGLEAEDSRYDVVIDCTGAPAAFDSVIDLVKTGGQIGVIGTHPAPVTISDPKIAHFKEASITWSMCYRDRNEFISALDLVLAGAIDFGPLTSGVISLDGYAEAFDAMADPEAAIKFLISPDGA